MVDYIANYIQSVRERPVFPNVLPGYLIESLPTQCPYTGENWKTILSDVEKYIMPGMTHWQSPHMHGYYPAPISYPSLLGEMLANGINSVAFTWASSPACTELEMIVMNWLGKMIGLPDEFMHFNKNSLGGGVLQTTTSEATLVALLSGRTKVLQEKVDSNYSAAEINALLVAYCSDQAHTSLIKASNISEVLIQINKRICLIKNF